MGIKKTREQFVKEVYDFVGDEYSILGEYQGADIKIKMKHNKCGHIYCVTPSNFLHGNRCLKCENLKRTKTTKQFKKEVYDLVGNDYSVLEEYKGALNKIKIKHNKCGNILNVTPSYFLNNPRCKKCYRKQNKNTKTKENNQFVKEVYDLVGNEYTFLEGYKGSQTKIKIIHNTCGYVYYVRPGGFLHGRRCPKCGGSMKKTNEQFKKEVYDLVKDEYTILEEYKNGKYPIKIKHNKCGHEYKVTPNSFLRGSRCPVCASSKGEEKIAKYLIKNNIPFTSQKTFDNLKDKGFLRFDFYLPRYNLIIEYDGAQHFRPIAFGGISEEQAEENFKNQQIRDKIKNKYCNENNINLLRIKYTDFGNIKKLLKNSIITF